VNRIVPDASVKGIVNERQSRLRLDTSVRLRWVAVLGQLLAIGVVIGVLGFELDVGICLGIIALSAWLNVFLSITYPARHRLSTSFATWLLAYDIVQLAALLYFTGGIQNPFAVLMIAPVALSAGTLPVRSTLLLGSVALAAAIVLYKLGILAALSAATVFMAMYTWRLSKEARQMAAALAATDMVLASEQRLHALDGLAAAAAHELGTPLSTIVLVSKELEYELGPDSKYREDLQLLHSQAQRCRQILQKLTRKPDDQDPMHASITVREIIEESSAPHRVSGKRIIITANAVAGSDESARQEPVGLRRPGVIYGLGNIIENAVDFAASEVEIDARWGGESVIVTISDDGPGFAPELMDTIGEPYITTRRFQDKGAKAHSGLGLGFFIAKTLLERSGATVSFSNRPAPRTGAVISIAWPRSSFEMRLTAAEPANA